MSKEVDTYRIFRELETREKRANPYKFYDKDELIDEILKLEDKIEELENINEKISLALESAETKLQQKENIIKEVREMVNTLYNNFMYDEDYRYDEDGDSILEIKQILDKEVN